MIVRRTSRLWGVLIGVLLWNGVAYAQPTATRLDTWLRQLDDADPARRGEAALEIEALDDPDAFSLLLAVLPRSSERNRAHVLTALRNFADPRKIQPFIALMREPNHGWATEAVTVQLHEIGKPIVEPLLTAANHCGRPLPEELEHSFDRWAGITVGTTGSVALDPLLRSARSPVMCHRWAATVGLSAYEASTPREKRLVHNALLRAKRDPSRLVRSALEEDVAPEGHRVMMVDLSALEGVELEELLRRLHSPNSATRRDTIADMELPAHQATPILTPMLTDLDPDVRLAAVEKLSILNRQSRGSSDATSRDPQDSVGPLLKAVDDSDLEVRLAAIQALVDIVPSGWGEKPGEVRPGPRLAALLSENNPQIVMAAIEALGELHDPVGIAELKRRFEAGDATIRQKAAEALAKMDAADLAAANLAPWFTDLVSDRDRIVRSGGAEGLNTMFERDSEAVLPPGLVPRLLAALDDKTIRDSLIIPLGHSRDPRVVAPLVALMNQGSNTAYRVAAALTVVGGTRAVEALILILDTYELPARRKAAAGLGKLRDRRAVEPLIRLLKDEDGDTRWVAAEALGHLGDARAVLPLVDELPDEVERVRHSTAESLGVLRDPRAVPALIRELRYNLPAAALALAEFGGQEIIAALQRRLQQVCASPRTDQAKFRDALAKALRKLGVSAVPLSKPDCLSRSSSTRRTARQALLYHSRINSIARPELRGDGRAR